MNGKEKKNSNKRIGWQLDWKINSEFDKNFVQMQLRIE